MAFKADLCRAWVEAQAAPRERYLTYVVAGTNTPVNPAPTGMRSGISFRGAGAIRDLANQLGLDAAEKVGSGVETTFLALSDQRVFYGSRSSFRNRPKDLLHEASATSFNVYWVDEDIGAGNRFRHLLLDFGEGAWRMERIGLTALNKDMSRRTDLHEFFEVLGDRAHPIGT